MSENKKQTNNPVAKLRELYHERKRNRKGPTEAIKDIFKKDKERSERKNEQERKIAKPTDRSHEADI